MTTKPGRVQALTSWLPTGTVLVAIGLVVNGAATYLFLGLPARTHRLDPDQYAIFSTLWFATYLIGPGLFIPLEQELGRRVAKARASERSSASDEKAALLIASLVTVALGVLLLIFSGPIGNRFFAGETVIVFVLAGAIAAHGVAQWIKGLLAGKGIFGGYGLLVGAEGLVRLALLTLVVIIGPEAVAPYTVPVALSPLVALLLLSTAVTPGFMATAVGSLRPIATALAILAAAQLAAQFLMNGVPLALAALVPDTDRDTVGRIGAALVLARVPLFLFQAVQASLLPGLASLAEIGDLSGFRRRVRNVSFGLGVLGMIAVVVGWFVGPLATRLLFGAEFEATNAEFGSLVLSAIAIVLALVFAQALIALDQHRLAALGWVVGAAGFVLTLAVPAELLTKVLVAGVVGPLVALGAMAMLLRRTAQAWPSQGAAEPG